MTIFYMEYDWLEWIKAVGTIILGIAAATIATNQFRVSRDKLRLDLFEKRFALFNTLYESWSAILGDRPNKVDYMESVKIRRVAYFLFGEEVTGYISIFYEKLAAFQTEETRLNSMNTAFAEHHVDNPRRMELYDKVLELRMELSNEIGVLTEKMRPYLQMNHKAD